MHRQVLEFFRTYLKEAEIQGKRVLEVGSRNVNGSVRGDVMKLQPLEYIGCDIELGNNVDIICDACHLTEFFGKESFDVIISTEMLEHVEDWQIAVSNIKQVCRPNGLIMISTRSIGFHVHDYPGDFWRYEMKDIPLIFEDCDLKLLIRDEPNKGVLFKALKPVKFQEKDLSDYQLYSIIDELLKRNRPMIRFIYNKFGKMPLVGAELGVAGGSNARYIMQLLNLSEFHLIDIWEDYGERNRIEQRYSSCYETVKTNFASYKNVQIHKAASLDKVKDFSDGQLDFIYIDANHTRMKEDIEAWFPKIKSGGVIGGHDYTSGWQEVKNDVDWWVDKLKIDGVKFQFYNEHPDWWITIL